MRKTIFTLAALFVVLTINAQDIKIATIQSELYLYFLPKVGKKVTLYEYTSDTINSYKNIETKNVWLDSLLCYSKNDTVYADVLGINDESPSAKYFYQIDRINNKGYVLIAYFSDKRKNNKGNIYEVKPTRTIINIFNKQIKNGYFNGVRLYYDPVYDEIIFKEKSIFKES